MWGTDAIKSVALSQTFTIDFQLNGVILRPCSYLILFLNHAVRLTPFLVYNTEY